MSDTKGKVNLLDTVPVQCGHITTGWEGEYAVLSFPRFKYDWMRCFLLPKSMSADIRVKLEEHGTAVWSLIDGKRTVQEIISLLTEHEHAWLNKYHQMVYDLVSPHLNEEEKAWLKEKTAEI